MFAAVYFKVVVTVLDYTHVCKIKNIIIKCLFHEWMFPS